MKTGRNCRCNRICQVSLSGKVKAAPVNHLAGLMNGDVSSGRRHRRSMTAWCRSRPTERTRPLR